MPIRKTNGQYEEWLRTQCKVIERGLEKKHKRMAKSAFQFLRATFFRWAGQITDIAAPLRPKDMPVVLSVGDIHCENYGTWRDEEGRLIWGINDFDEAADIPYAFDLVRLATSIRLAEKVKLDDRHVARKLIDGYRAGLHRPRPTLPDQHERALRDYVQCDAQCRQEFWEKIETCKPATPPPEVVDLLRAGLPHDAHVERFARHQSGGGSLGRPRYLVVAHWHGGQIVREAKALVPSAWIWAQKDKGRGMPPRFLDLATGRYRAPDPFLTVQQSWVVRRLAPDSRKIALEDIRESEIKDDLIRAMGRDLGAIHAMTDGKAPEVLAHLDRLGDPAWLFRTAETAAEKVEKDYKAWRKAMKGKDKDKKKGADGG
ncbi:MAG: DUF2252 family protein [Reyranellaceae bacterium]